jgi:hypothetical protein
MLNNIAHSWAYIQGTYVWGAYIWNEVSVMHLSMLTPRGGGGSAICGVFDHQLHPHPGDFD